MNDINNNNNNNNIKNDIEEKEEINIINDNNSSDLVQNLLNSLPPLNEPINDLSFIPTKQNMTYNMPSYHTFNRTTTSDVMITTVTIKRYDEFLPHRNRNSELKKIQINFPYEIDDVFQMRVPPTGSNLELLQNKHLNQKFTSLSLNKKSNNNNKKKKKYINNNKNNSTTLFQRMCDLNLKEKESRKLQLEHRIFMEKLKKEKDERLRIENINAIIIQSYIRSYITRIKIYNLYNYSYKKYNENNNNQENNNNNNKENVFNKKELINDLIKISDNAGLEPIPGITLGKNNKKKKIKKKKFIKKKKKKKKRLNSFDIY